MIARLAVVLALLASVLAQYVFPDVPVYQYGWYSVIIAALFVIALLQSRIKKASNEPLDAVAMIFIRIGMGLVALAGIANGLLAPAPATSIASPGTALPIAALHGTVDFPLVSNADGAGAQPVLLQGGKNIPLCIGRARIIGSFEVWCLPREVLTVQAFDTNGAHLTITQPAGAAFLSPVLLLAERQSIANMLLPYDTFAIPAAHRIVNVVFFDARHAATLRNTNLGQSALLFAVDDETGRPLSHSIRLATSGERIPIGGVQLSGTAFMYPALRVVPVPMPFLVLAGIVAIVLGMLLYIRSRGFYVSKSKNII
jgi:hypothetical protein